MHDEIVVQPKGRLARQERIIRNDHRITSRAFITCRLGCLGITWCDVSQSNLRLDLREGCSYEIMDVGCLLLAIMHESRRPGAAMQKFSLSLIQSVVFSPPTWRGLPQQACHLPLQPDDAAGREQRLFPAWVPQKKSRGKCIDIKAKSSKQKANMQVKSKHKSWPLFAPPCFLFPSTLRGWGLGSGLQSTGGGHTARKGIPSNNG